MKQKDKELLLKDLCARLPYTLMCITKDRYASDDYWDDIDIEEDVFELDIEDVAEFMRNETDIKPYLRPMLSMTEEEKRTYDSLACDFDGISMVNSIDWLNQHHFDYRGLIEKGLALEAPSDMYK